MRATWDQTWMSVATAMSRRAKCTNRQVGAVIVDENNRPISVGYNGAPAGFQAAESCSDFCPRSGSADRSSDYTNCVSVHAEANALIFADRALYKGGTIYVTNPCCWDCSKLVANSGLARVVVRLTEADAHADIGTPIHFMQACGLQVEVLEEKTNDISKGA